MADPHLKSTLERKCCEIESLIESYRTRLAEAQSDLVHLRATITLFERDARPAAHRSDQTISISTLYKMGELEALCQNALRDHGPELSTTRLSDICLHLKGQDRADKLLARSVAQKVGIIMKTLEAKGMVRSPGKQGVVRVWQLVASGMSVAA